MNDTGGVRADWATAPTERPAGLDVRVIAFYVPQFHPTEENDHWWGRGFTDWHNIACGQPLFDGHDQPRLPRELGFYDLRIDEVRRAQVALARAHGIHGFCYHYHWFNGRRLFDEPLNRYVADPAIDFPFCVCWTNENWTRRWDGGDEEVLLAQAHDLESDMKFILEVIPLLQDRRYIRVDGRPLLLLYRIDRLKEPKKTAEGWRQACHDAGLPGVHLCAVQTRGSADPREFGFDSACEFPSRRHDTTAITGQVAGLSAEFRGAVLDYEMVARQSLTRPAPDYMLYRTLLPGWDNSSRRGRDATILHNASPERYEHWLRGLVEYSQRNLRGDSRIIFVNAWNDWAEGAHLEPDLKHGTAYLDATRRALNDQTDPQQLVHLLLTELGSVRARDLRERLTGYAREIGAQFQHLRRTVDFFTDERRMVERLEAERKAAVFHRQTLDELFGADPATDIEFQLETINGQPLRDGLLVDINNTAFASGWMVAPGIASDADTTTRYLLLKSVEHGTVYAAQFTRASPRQDVEAARPELESRFTLYSGFDLLFSLSRLPGDAYLIGAGLVGTDKAAYAWSPHRIRLVE